MAEVTSEKMATTTSHTAGADTPPPPSYDAEGQPITTMRLGKPWMYKRLNLGFFSLPPYASPEFQIVYVAFVCFLCPGMYNALSGLGAGGLLDPHDVNRSSIGLYATFSIVGFFAGSIANKIGLRLTLAIGGLGYPIYSASILTYNHTHNAGFLIFAGCLLGACAGLLWCAQGAMMMAYPLEKAKGRSISIFWMIFNLGAVLGSLIPLGQNIHKTEAGTVSDGTYVGFIVLMALGWALCFFACNPKFVERSDGSHVIMMKNPTWWSEIKGLVQTLITDWWIIFLFPFFLSSNWFYTYHFQDFNLARFDVRTRSLNGVLYWTSQIVGAAIFGFSLDSQRLSRRTRAKICTLVLFIFVMVVWGGGYNWQRHYTRDQVANKEIAPLDWQSSGYVGPMFLYMFYGMFDAAWQTSAYWLMGSMSNNGRKLANFAGFYKGIQSAGGSISPSIDANKAPYMTEFAINWGLLAGSLIVATPIIWWKVTDKTDIEKDLAFSDETKADVVPAEQLATEARTSQSEKI